MVDREDLRCFVFILQQLWDLDNELFLDKLIWLMGDPEGVICNSFSVLFVDVEPPDKGRSTIDIHKGWRIALGFEQTVLAEPLEVQKVTFWACKCIIFACEVNIGDALALECFYDELAFWYESEILTTMDQ